MTQPYDAPKRTISKAPAIQSEAGSTAGMVFGIVAALCGCSLLIMATIKIGFIWFT